ncbi:Nuclear distribution protein [Colletotrichum higginsianum IMI 349063]|uniref:Nuclear distribution protein n=1 Tax=Colletotrichum higginsianum (strain IMI 349063) TaxID=759273 RepID=A0A1B7Y8B2_COLHI|nr:Nuclear distribution protein [Colletotrichum higginsianum IMI 349063]OBR08247.1 Nuclear distribution protein [Colletotrichum higginsianum IMI 349063]GJC97676.1 nuclear distribution protein [Colletotrichum higginsianum]
MDNSLDNTTLSTVSLLESRLLRIEHLLYGPTAASPSSQTESAVDTLQDLERRFNHLLSRIRVYGELMKICTSSAHLMPTSLTRVVDNFHPTLFQPPPPPEPPTQLAPEAVQATVLASAASFPATASSLTSVNDCPIPESSQSAALASLVPKMRGIETMQIAQEAEMADLRARSEEVLKRWYQHSILGASEFVADVEGRVELVERRVRRAEREKEEAAAI